MKNRPRFLQRRKTPKLRVATDRNSKDLPNDYEILIKEYEYTTAWVRGLESRWFRVLAFFAPVISALFFAGYKYDIGEAFLFVPFLVILFQAIEIGVRVPMGHLGAYICSLEKRINACTTKNLLNWEQRFSTPKMFMSPVLRDANGDFLLLNPFYFQGFMIGFFELLILVASVTRGINFLNRISPEWSIPYGIACGYFTLLTLYFAIKAIFYAPVFSESHIGKFIEEGNMEALFHDKKAELPAKRNFLFNYHRKDEYLDISSNVRHWGTIRFVQISVFFVITLGVLSALFRPGQTLSFEMKTVFKVSGFLLTTVFFILEQRAMEYWRRLRERAKELEGSLGYKQYTEGPAVGLVSSTNAVRLLFIVPGFFWIFNIFYP